MSVFAVRGDDHAVGEGEAAGDDLRGAVGLDEDDIGELVVASAHEAEPELLVLRVVRTRRGGDRASWPAASWLRCCILGHLPAQTPAVI